MAADSLTAFFGSFLGSRVLEKITLRTLRIIIAAILFLIAIALGMGII